MREIRGCTGRGKEFCGAGRVREGNFVGREKTGMGGNGAAGEERNGGKKREAKRRAGRLGNAKWKRMWAGDFFAEGAEKYLTLCQGSV